jgi:hypothetical protein
MQIAAPAADNSDADLLLLVNNITGMRLGVVSIVTENKIILNQDKSLQSTAT